MYQYFENKLDLYRWLVTDELERRRTQWLESDSQQREHLERNGDGGLFAALEQMVVMRVGFMLAHPRLARLAASAMEPSTDDDLRELHADLRKQQIDRLTARIVEASSAGEIRADIDARTAAHLIDALVLRGTTNAVLDRLGIDVNEFLSNPEATARLTQQQWRALVDETMSMIRGGIAAQAQSHTQRGSSGTRPEPKRGAVAQIQPYSKIATRA